MTPQEIEVLIRGHLPDTTATVQSTDNVHFEAVVVSPCVCRQAHPCSATG